MLEICNNLILAQSMPSGAVHPNKLGHYQLPCSPFVPLQQYMRRAAPAAMNEASAAGLFRLRPRGIRRHPLVLPRVAMSASKPPFDSIRDLVVSMPEASEASRQAVRARQAELTKPRPAFGIRLILPLSLRTVQP